MQDTINLEEKDNLKLSSMHHFKLNRREVVQVLRFTGRQNCHQLYLLLLNYISQMNEKRKTTKEGPQTQIIAPRPFMDCIYKECTMTYKGIVETRPRASATTSQIDAATSHLNMKFNGIIFPQPIRRICNMARAVLSYPKNSGVVDQITLGLKADDNSHAFSYKQQVKQVLLSAGDDSYKVRIE